MNQNSDNYWKRLKTSFDERKLCDPDFNTIHMERGEKAMANHSAIIQQVCSKWHGIQEEVLARPESGANVERQVSSYSSCSIVMLSSPVLMNFFLLINRWSGCSTPNVRTTRTPT